MKHTPWKTAVAAVAGTSLLLGLGACGRSEDKPAGASEGAVTSIDSEPATGDLTVWAMGNEGDLLGDFVDGFKEENPDVNITVTAIPWASAHDKIQTAIAAGTVPDVIQMGTIWMADFADAFAPVPENFDLSDFSAGPLEAGQVDGEQLGVPWYVDSHVLYYRTDIAAQAGWDHAPETLDELRQMAEGVKQVDGVENGMYISPSGADFVVMDEAANPEAAAVDGSGKWRTFTSITLPLMKPTILLGAVLISVAYLQFFEESFVMTQGGPLDSTLSAAYYVYQQFGFGRYGIASAASWVLFVIIAVVSVLQFRILGSDE